MAAAIQMNIAVGVNKCYAIIGKGTQCTANVSSDGLCGIHLSCRRYKGPLTFDLNQLKLKQKNEMKAFKEERDNALMNAAGNRGELRMIYASRHIIMRGRHAQEEQEVRARFADAREDLRAAQAAIDERNRLREEQRRVDRERVNQMLMERHRQLRDEDIARRLQHEENLQAARVALAAAMIPGQAPIIGGFGGMGRQPLIGGFGADQHAWAGAEGVVFAPAAPAPAPGARGIGDIARDPQSVHTTEVVKHTKEIVAKVRAIPVPEEYRWDKDVCSKTPGEIIVECRLPQKAAHQMMSQYALDTAIYDIEEGIYGKVLDSMWQFVKGHAEKDSLKAIIRDELNAGVGMCAQGNLTRVCNILAGYLEGVGAKESVADKMGRLLPPLRDIENPDERRARAEEILRANEVPLDDWDTWLDAVMD